jgi:D-alanine-D-alanine ligase
MALVPAVCEAYGIRFVGADTYARILCQDKQLAKQYAQGFGLLTPESLLIRSQEEIGLLRNLTFPIVVKPLLEDSSIGINSDSLARDYESALKRTQTLLNKFNQPILAEEFVRGKEVCVCVSGPRNQVLLLEAIEVFAKNIDNFFDQNLYTAENKQNPKLDFDHRSITKEMDATLIKRLTSLFTSLDKVDYLRIDGKLDKDIFTLIELTPDAYLGTDSSFALAFREKGCDYTQMLTSIINNALDYYRTPYSNV